MGGISISDSVELMSGDRWYALQGELRVFGNRLVRDEFDQMMQAARRLRELNLAASPRKPAEASAVAKVVHETRMHAARVRTAVSAEIGPLRDHLDFRPPRWWRISTWKDRRRGRRAEPVKGEASESLS
jgi:hypothetical protein